NKIVLLKTSPGGNEVETPATHRPIAAIVLTGGRNPPHQLLEAAKKGNISLVLTKEDTFAALERLEQSTSHLSPRDEAKIRHLTALMDSDGSLDRLIESLGRHHS
ncbi:MAG: DRTGG domain-containing protein, partial [Desulfobacteraceae bacterium]